MIRLVATARTPTGPAFTVVLICHVASVLLALVAAVTGIVAAALTLTAKEELTPWVRSYFSPGVNWAGRVLYLVPVFGAALLVMSGGAYQLGDTWVEVGLGLWASAVLLGESVLWPAERRVQRALAEWAGQGVPATVRGSCRTMFASAAGLVMLVIAAMVVMMAKP
ncbi:MAG: hypothetical protein ACP5PM_04075 [Acidimicrobiales bacterium]